MVVPQLRNAFVACAWGEVLYLALLDNVVGIRLGEASRFQHVGNVLLPAAGDMTNKQGA